jgi:hypothetical protein
MPAWKMVSTSVIERLPKGRPRIRRVVALCAAILWLASCDSSPAAEGAAVTLLAPDGPPTLVYVLCDDQEIDLVRLIREKGDSPYDGDDEVLWELAGGPGSTAETIEIGGTPPPGLLEEKPLTEQVAPDDDLVLMVRVDGIDVGIGYTIEDLEAGRATQQGGTESMTQFRDEAACD